MAAKRSKRDEMCEICSHAEWDYVRGERKHPEIENLFMTRAKSHEIMMMLFRANTCGEHTRDILSARR
jgi:hypothetical protein